MLGNRPMIQRWEPKPTDGYAYNAQELQAIWELEVDVRSIIELHEKQWTFLEHCIRVMRDPMDEQRRSILLRALLAEWENPKQCPSPEWPCTDPLCVNNPAVIEFDHENMNGWVHGDDPDTIN